MSDTPRTDRVLKNCNGWHHVPIELARELERELNEANDRIKRLEEAGNKMAYLLDGGVFMKLAVQWNEAKEAKP